MSGVLELLEAGEIHCGELEVFCWGSIVIEEEMVSGGEEEDNGE